MKYSRIAAMFLGVNKDQTRAINDDFMSENVARRLDNRNPAKMLLDGITRVKPIDGLDDSLGDTPEPEVVDAKELAKNIIRQRVDDKGFISNDLSPTLEELKKNIILASEDIITKNKRISIMATPADELREIREGLENVVQLFSQVSSQRDFDAEKFGYELSKAEESLAELVGLFRNSSRH
jgi:predicted RNA-binding protein with PUA-like domain